MQMQSKRDSIASRKHIKWNPISHKLCTQNRVLVSVVWTRKEMTVREGIQVIEFI
jgi:hypothetical protein